MNRTGIKKDFLRDKSFEFALQLVKLYKQLTADSKEYVLSKQLLRSGTSIGACVREAKNAESKNDFIHKLSIAQKECDESMYWIELLYQSHYLSLPDYENLSDQALQLIKMIRSSIITTKQSLTRK
ncbi:MAG TPA: four helix bundle protein [Bacteroidia bacterium]|nr:four helix bundle protein [Bacteroidia bacterium]HNU34491.1 four helix bundle protein [Bacteroidia bacterium]